MAVATVVAAASVFVVAASYGGSGVGLLPLRMLRGLTRLLLRLRPDGGGGEA